MILYSNKLYSLLSKYLTIFERKGKKIDEHKYHKDEDYEIILFGYNRIGFDILEALKKIRKKFLIIDFNPETIIKLSKQGYNCRYGDANDSVLLDELKFEKVKMVISTIPVLDTNLLIITKVREANPKAIIAVVSHQIEEAKKLYEAGATYVIMPHFLGGKHFAHLIEKNKINRTQFLKERRAQLRDLKRRLELGHRHPKHDDR
ncbi:MAG: hypothetical protein PWP03_507 [Candidatus Woesearchaeota archaeon]|nr:hypothetical protein [Candidatus Woesearchaeota archaeon]